MQEIIKQQRMTSIEIAEVTGKLHKDVMKAIRNMEPAWGKVNGRNFALVEYRDKKGESRPMYSLTKTECLYVATKFNDEARARLVLRWEELEQERLQTKATAFTDEDILAKAVLISMEQIKRLTHKVETLQPKADYLDEVIDSVSCLTTTQIAKELGMSAIKLNQMLCNMGIQFVQSGQYMLYADYARRDYARNRSHAYRDLFGELHTRTYLVWTERGREFIHRKFKNFTNF